MLNTQDLLTIYSYNGSTYTDLSVALNELKSDNTASITLSTTTVLYVGYRKKINNLSFVMTTLNSTANTLVVEAVGYGALVVIDETKNFTKLGNIFWTNPDFTVSTINSKEMYWYKISASTTLSSITFEAITQYFCNVSDVKAILPQLSDANLFGNDKAIYNIIELSKENIIQKLTNKGILTKQSHVSIFDFTRIYELNKASSYDVVANICLLLSDNDGDKYEKLHKEYKAKAEEFLNTYFFSYENSTDVLNSSAIRQVKTGVFVR